MASPTRLRIGLILPVLFLAGGAIAQDADRSAARPPGEAANQPYVPPVTAARIRTAIDDATTYLRSRQQADGSIQGDRNGYGGDTALAALAVLAAGGDPASDDALRKSLDWLAKVEVDNTYVRAVRANVWEYALRKVPYDQNIRNALKADFEWLLKALGDKQAWRYHLNSTDWDNSCTQYGVLGIWAAARAGFDPGDQFWQRMSKHFRGCQNPDGGWSYTTGSSTANMATAGLASMFLVFDMLFSKTAYSSQTGNPFATGDAAACLKSIQAGMNWLGQPRADKTGGYYLYGIERTGVAGGRKHIGDEDWFAVGAEQVLRLQQRDGSFGGARWGGPVVETAFCTLFLVYGGAPVAINKLQYGDAEDWNLNPRDLANLSKHLWSAYEKPVNWYSVSITAPGSEFEAPILFISGAKPADFGPEQMHKLRNYVLGGGTILAEPSDHSRQFAASMERLLAEMFPPAIYPDHKLAALPDDHPVYTVIRQDWKDRPRLRGASNGSRTFFLLSDGYMSADWQMNRTEADSFKLAMNLLFYVTDLGELPGRFHSILPQTPPARGRQHQVRVARVRHGDKNRSFDWDAAAATWSVYGPYVRHITGCELVEAAPVGLLKDKPENVNLLHITGRGEMKLSAAERAALKEFAESGGTVLIDAYAGSQAFAASARAELEAIFGGLQPLPENDILAEGRFEGGADLARASLRLPARQLLARRGLSPRGQKLLVARVKDRPAVIFSELDLSAGLAGIENFRCLGYTAESARRIVGNIIAYMTAD